MENEEGRFSSDDTHMHRDSLPPLLELADEIQLRCESWRWRSTRLRAGIYFTLLTVLTITIIAFFTFDLFQRGGTPFIIAIVSTFVYISASTTYALIIIRRMDWKARKDERALREVVKMLHEISHTLANDEFWSPLQMAEFRIRLSKYDV